MSHQILIGSNDLGINQSFVGLFVQTNIYTYLIYFIKTQTFIIKFLWDQMTLVSINSLFKYFYLF